MYVHMYVCSHATKGDDFKFKKKRERGREGDRERRGGREGENTLFPASITGLISPVVHCSIRGSQ